MRMYTFLTALVVTLFAASGVPVAAQTGDAASLLAKHKAFVGWQFGDGTFHYLRQTGVIAKSDGTTGDLDATFTTVRANTVYRTTRTTTATGLSTDSGFTGNIFWQTDANGFIRPVIGDAQKYQVSRELVYTEGTTAFDGTLHGSATVNGVAVSIVRIAPSAALPIDLYVDPATGAYKRIVFDPDGAFRTTVDILTYIDGPSGKKFIGSFKVPNSGYTTTLKTIEAPASIDVALFAPPHPTATWSFDPTNAPVPITYDWYRTHRIYFHAKVNGVEGYFILDTGAGIGIALTQMFADKLKLKEIKSGYAVGVGGSVSAKTARVDSIEVGGNTLKNVAISAQPVQLDADGLMGLDLLEGVVAHLDLDARTLTLYDPASADLTTLAAGGLPLVVDMNNGIPAVPMLVDGRIPVRAELDTGVPYYALFGPDLIYKDHLVMMQHATIVRGIGGYEFVECGSVSEIELGPVKYASAPACESKSFDGHTILVGLDFLRHFDFWFDYPQSQIVLSPRTTSE
jgi:Aspartyl protease